VLFGVAAVVLAVDQLTKAWALDALGSGRVIRLIGNWLTLRLVFNSGAALSLGSSMTWAFTILALGVAVGVMFYARRVKGTALAATLGLLLAGAGGNLVDRLARAPSFGQGHVVDFIGYGNLFVGNVADIAIVLAMILMVFGVLRGWGPVRPAAEGETAAGGDPDAADGDLDAAGVNSDVEAVADGVDGACGAAVDAGEANLDDVARGGDEAAAVSAEGEPAAGEADGRGEPAGGDVDPGTAADESIAATAEAGAPATADGIGHRVPQGQAAS
jgi:signal peptidase II